MPSLESQFDEILGALSDAFGRPDRPAEVGGGTFRDLVRSFLELRRGVRPGPMLERIDRAGLTIDPAALAAIDPVELADLLREPGRPLPAGVVAELRRLAGWVVERGGLEELDRLDAATLREELRSLRGIGPASADRLLGEGLGRAVFPIDRTTYRVLVRHGWADESADLDEVRASIERSAGDDPALLLDLADWMGRLGTYCRVAAPHCERCPLRPFLPQGGPIEIL